MAKNLLPWVVTATAALASIGCAQQAPPKMGVERHEEAALTEQRAAAAADPCTSGREKVEAPCWSSNSSQVEEHQRAAAEHQHSADLQRAEQQACAEVSTRDRTQSPFSHQADILSVQPLVLKSRDGGGSRAVGAAVQFRKVPHLTAALLKQIVDCHLARNAALGLDRPDLDYCPLTVNPLGFKNLKTEVSEGPNGLVLKLETSDSEDVAHEILLRAQRAAGPARCLTAPAETST